MNVFPLVLIGVGSNLPWQEKSSVDVVRDALESLRVFAADQFRVSSLYRTTPVDCPTGSGEFINAAAAFVPHVDLTPGILLAKLKSLEAVHGRTLATVRNAPRVLDLDILAFGDTLLNEPELVLPHPRATQRAFVMIPLQEIAAGFVWPGTGVTVAALAQLAASVDGPDGDGHVLPMSPH